ncbi:MAG: EAL domain-containing protein [Candidatus Limnocylindrales bacterium]
MTNGRAGTADPNLGMRAGGVAVRGIPSDTAAALDRPPVAAGEAPSQFRLVRLRLALALLAAASIPIAIAIIVPTLLGSGRVDQTQAVQAGSQVSTGVAAELERSRSALLLLAANPSTVRLAIGTGPAADTRTDLQSISAVVAARVAVAAVVDASGVERLRLEDGRVVPPQTDPVDASLLHATLALDAGEIYRSEPFVGPTGPSRIAIAAPLLNAGKAVGLVRLDLSLPGLLTAPQADIAARGGYALIVDTATGDVVADGRSQLGASGPPQPGSTAQPGLPGPDQLLARVVSQAGQTWTSLLSGNWSVDYAPLDTAIPGFGDWAVVVALPATPSAPPVALLAALALLILLLVVLALWMAHEVLQPAAELDRSHQELSRQFEVALHDALHDSLTGLGNHRAFHEELDRQMQISRRYGVPVALLLLDLDDFKHVNDSAGHAAGDAVLTSIGRFLDGHIRATDLAFRIGGDEFAVVMPHTDMDGGVVVARRMLGMALEPVATSALPKPVSFSAGVSAIPVPAESRAELYAQADAALIWCKRHGRTSVAAFDPTRHTLDSQDAMATLSQSVAAVAAQRALRPVFQPVVELASGRVIGFEGLIRPAAGSGFADPGSMFVAAERCGRTVELDQACLEVIASAATAIPGDRSISLNLSPRTLEAPEFNAHALSRTLERLGLSLSRVVIELTEREAIDDMELLASNLQACRRAGMRIAADDVGSGNAGLRLLSQIHFDIVKIDLSLVQGGTARESSLAVLRSLVDLGKRWGSVVVAEGVETPDQLRVLRSLDVTSAQGYLLGRPSDDVQIESVDLDALMAPTTNLMGWAAIRATPA